MPCCKECMGKAKKDCDENPLNCFDFYLLNKETIDELREYWIENGVNENVYDTNDVLNSIDYQPTADVVEVVRCCDCKHIAIINNSKLYAKCKKTNYEFNPFETDTRSHFCSFGERRAEE